MQGPCSTCRCTCRCGALTFRGATALQQKPLPGEEERGENTKCSSGAAPCRNADPSSWCVSVARPRLISPPLARKQRSSCTWHGRTRSLASRVPMGAVSSMRTARRAMRLRSGRVRAGRRLCPRRGGNPLSRGSGAAAVPAHQGRRCRGGAWAWASGRGGAHHCARRFRAMQDEREASPGFTKKGMWKEIHSERDRASR